MDTSTGYQGSLESRKDFKQTPSGQYKYWLSELKASDKLLENFHKDGSKVVDRFKGGAGRTRLHDGTRAGGFNLNLFHSNVVTLQSMLYGNLPKVTVKRRNSDTNDDVGRVASMILQRLLNNDVQDNGKEYNSVLRAVLQDRLLPGLGVARVRFNFNPDAPGSEEAPTDYYHWRDVRYGWARTFSDIPWVGFRSYLNKDQAGARFGEEVAKLLTYETESTAADKNEEAIRGDDTDSAWKKTQIWEIWDKPTRKVVWISPGYDKVLDTKDDPLGLAGFFPNPPFLLANPTTTLYVPVSDFYLAQDLYNEIDVLQTRISILTEAVKVVGVYNREAEGIQRMFNEGVDNDLIPVDNWALFDEKGRIAGQIDWVPIKDVSETIERLRKIQNDTIGLLQQVTGMSDIMRGELGGQYEGVGQSELKAKFGSVRVQALQDEFANFASDLLQLKAEVIGNHFDAETIAKYANVEGIFPADQQLVPAAIELIKNPSEARMRVSVSPESVAMVDYAQLKQERTEYITALATFLQSSGPIMEQEPAAKPFLLQLLQWGLAGFKGADEIEGVLDQAIEAAQKADEEAKNNPQPDPEQAKMQMEQQMAQMQNQHELQLEQMRHQNGMKEAQAKFQSDMVLRKADEESDKATRAHDMQMEQAEIIANMQSDLATISAKMHADIQTEAQSSEVDALQNAAAVRGEMMKEAHKTSLEMTKNVAQTEQKIKEAKAVEKAKPKPKPAGPKK